MVQIAANSAIIYTQSMDDITCISIFMGQKDHVAEKLNWWNFAYIQYLYSTICAQKKQLLTDTTTYLHY